MTDKQRTCGDCAWFKQHHGGYCHCPSSLLGLYGVFTKSHQDATKCETFRSHSDQALIDECHKLRSLGGAVEWQKIDRLVEIASGRDLERVKRCEACEGSGGYSVNGVYVDLHGDRVECHKCQGTGYKKGGDE